MANPAKAKHPGGRPPWEPTEKDRLLIQLCVADGMTRDQIAKVIGKDEDTLLKHCREELESGDVKLHARVTGHLMAKIQKGDTAAIIWYEKTRRGMREIVRSEHTGKDGGPIEYQNLSDEEIDARIAAVTAEHGPRVTTH